jgi:hypothetical protein
MDWRFGGDMVLRCPRMKGTIILCHGISGISLSARDKRRQHTTDGRGAVIIEPDEETVAIRLMTFVNPCADDGAIRVDANGRLP